MPEVNGNFDGTLFRNPARTSAERNCRSAANLPAGYLDRPALCDCHRDMTSSENLADVSATVHRHSESSGERPALAFVQDPAVPSSARWWTYSELDREARAIATHLAARLEVGSRVLLIYPPGGEFVTALLGCIYAGMIAVPVSMPGKLGHARRRVLNIAEDARVAMVLSGDPIHAEIQSWAATSGLEQPVIPHASVATHDDPIAAPRPAGPGTVALLQYTSGSTGDPKGSVVTHQNLVVNAGTMARTFGFDETTRSGSWLPHYHDMGIGVIMPLLLCGGSVVLMDPAVFLRRPVGWLTLISTYRVTFSASPNFGYELCCRRVSDEDSTGLDLSSWRHAINGSEPVRSSTVREFTRRFSAVGLRPEALVPSYGMAEATVFVAASPDRPAVIARFDREALADHLLRPAESAGDARELVGCGRPRDLDLRIVDPAGRLRGDGEIGEIWLRGASVVPGYWGRAEATSHAFNARIGDEDGFLRTGDLGAVVDGELFVTGRIKEMLIFRGRNLYPHDVEQEVRLHHELLKHGNGAAVAVPAENGAGDAEDHLVLLHEVAGRPLPDELAATATAIQETVVREFGVRCQQVVLLRRGGVRRTTSGKVERSEMRRAYLAGELRPLFDSALG
ncbi:fatty acyl-AMP ligase [Micromonospora marina]|nr:fatty acyl-AMP ligase [Micromonospora marina]